MFRTAIAPPTAANGLACLEGTLGVLVTSCLDSASKISPDAPRAFARWRVATGVGRGMIGADLVGTPSA